METVDHEQIFFDAIIVTATKYLYQLGMKRVLPQTVRLEDIRLEDVTAFIQISGVIEGGFILTAEQRLSQVLAKRYILDKISDEEAVHYALEVVAEIANVICGNALTEREENDIFLGNPLLIVAKKAEIRTKCPQRYIQKFSTEEGNFRCIYIPMESNSELASILTIQAD